MLLGFMNHGIVLPDTFMTGIVASVVFAFMGIMFLLIGFKMFDWILPKVDFQEAMKQSHIGTCIVISAFFAALAYIIGMVIS